MAAGAEQHPGAALAGEVGRRVPSTGSTRYRHGPPGVADHDRLVVALEHGGARPPLARATSARRAARWSARSSTPNTSSPPSVRTTVSSTCRDRRRRPRPHARSRTSGPRRPARRQCLRRRASVIVGRRWIGRPLGGHALFVPCADEPHPVSTGSTPRRPRCGEVVRDVEHHVDVDARRRRHPLHLARHLRRRHHLRLRHPQSDRFRLTDRMEITRWRPRAGHGRAPRRPGHRHRHVHPASRRAGAPASPGRSACASRGGWAVRSARSSAARCCGSIWKRQPPHPEGRRRRPSAGSENADRPSSERPRCNPRRARQ